MNGVILCRGWGLDDTVRRFWSGRRWVVDPSDAELFQGTKWHAVYHRLCAQNATDRAIVGVRNYGLLDEQTVKPRSL
jgi:hypothetical protein